MVELKYAKIVNNFVEKYPYEIKDLRLDNPNVSFPTIIDDNTRAEYGMFVVQQSEKPTDYTKNIYEGIPEYINGTLTQIWTIEDATESEINNRIAQEWNKVRDERNARLNESDWTQITDSPLTEEQKNAWRQYRQELRDITNQANPFEVILPQKPSF